MRTQSVEKKADTRGAFAPEADRQRWQARRTSVREDLLDSGAAALAEALVAPDARACQAGLEAALDLFGRAFEARRIVLYIDPELDPALDFGIAGDGSAAARPHLRRAGLLEPARVWTPTEGSLAAGPDTPPMPTAAIRDGRTRSGPDAMAPATSGAPAPGGWATRTQHEVEVPGAAGPAAVFVIEGGLSAMRWSERLLGRAKLVGRLLGAALDRTRLAREVDTIRARLAQSNRLESVGRVATAVAHDFNNVLTAIQGYADLLEMELADRPVGTEELSEIRQAAERAAELVDQVLRFGRRREAKIDSLDLIATLTGFEGLIARVLGRGVELTIEGEEALPAVRLDAGRFEPVAMNLASNARDAIAKRGGSGRFSFIARSVTIDGDGREVDSGECVPELEPGEYVRLTARDDGCGIDPAIRDRIFEPYFTTKPEGEGTGLGLASLARFQRASKGGIRIESEPGHGTALHLYYPVAPPEAD